MKLHWDLCIINSFYELCRLTLVYSACKVMFSFRKNSYERDFFFLPPSKPKLPCSSIVERGRAILCMCLIEIPALHSKLSRNFSWEVALCNYPNHSFKSTGAVRYSREGLYTYWQEMSRTQWRTDVSEMSLVEQNAFVVSWYLWLRLCRKDLIKQSKMQRKSAYANVSTWFFLHLIAYCLVLLLLFGGFFVLAALKWLIAIFTSTFR